MKKQMKERTETNDRHEIGPAIIILESLHDQLLYVANYMELKGMMTQEETRRLDRTRHEIAAKVMQLLE